MLDGRMCGRYQSRFDKQRIAEEFRVTNLEELEILPPDYNIAPTTEQPVIVADRDSGDRVLRRMRWGLIPYWAKDPSKVGLSTVNAMAETVTAKPMWKTALERRRCIVPADGFYEWQTLSGKTKQPFLFTLKSGRMMGMAGLWERWKSLDGSRRIDSFSILTTEANELAATVHTRMPVILEPENYARWLENAPGARPPIDLLRPLEAERMTAWKVDARVGNVRNNEPSLCDPLA